MATKTINGFQATADYAFAIAYFATILGQPGSVTDDGMVAFSCSDLRQYKDGSIPFAAAIYANSGSPYVWINDDLPENMWYHLIGYATANGLEIEK